MVLAHHTEPVILQRGYLGVDLFFVLSGFLITNLLLEEWQTTNAIDFRSFYARRALRLFPALAVMLSASALMMYFVPGVGQNYRSILYAVFYVSNWVMALNLDQMSSTLILTWSLAIEEQFYLLWPLALHLAVRRRMRARAMLIGLTCLIVLICMHRSFLFLQGAPELRVMFASDTRADSLLAGCCVGIIANAGLLPRRIGLLGKLVIGALALVFTLYLVGVGQPEGVGLSVIAVFFGGLLVLLLSDPPKALLAVLNNRMLVWIGKISYGLYLWHLYAFFAVEMSGIDRKFQIVASIPLAFAFAIISYVLIERPFLKLKRRFANST